MFLMRAFFNAILNFVWTILYFLGWGGLTYGPLLGFIVGTTLFPGVGSIAGIFLGIACGVIAGVMIGVSVALYQALFFSCNTDLALYRHHLARMVGIGTLLFGLFLVAYTLHGSPHYETSAGAWFVSLSLGTMTFIWISLTGAYTAYHYPDQLVKRLIWQDHRLEDFPAPLESQSALSEAEGFLSTIYPRWLHGVAVLLCLIGIAILVSKEIMKIEADLPILISLVAVGGMVVIFIFAAYCALGSGLLVILVKQMVLNEFFPNLTPHRIRITLTLIAFVYTLIQTWWTVIFAPLCAFYIAYKVYHTLALPTYGDEKAKRKEKRSTEDVSRLRADAA